MCVRACGSTRSGLLAQDYDCQCNYDLKGEGWGQWVEQWMQDATPKSGFSWQGWFGRGKAPSYALDFAACWVNNPRECAIATLDSADAGAPPSHESQRARLLTGALARVSQHDSAPERDVVSAAAVVQPDAAELVVERERCDQPTPLLGLERGHHRTPHAPHAACSTRPHAPHVACFTRRMLHTPPHAAPHAECTTCMYRSPHAPHVAPHAECSTRHNLHLLHPPLQRMTATVPRTAQVPVTGSAMDNPANWDAIFVKLPAAICGGHGKADSVTCLSDGAQRQLETDLANYVNNQILWPGAGNVDKRPGSAVVFLNEEARNGRWGQQFSRRFACENWTSPSNRFKIVESNGVCYIDYA
jgi:hypothetical protein